VLKKEKDGKDQLDPSCEKKKYHEYLKSGSSGISYIKYVNVRQTGLVTFCVETAFYNGLLKER
jgi:hypothetical protein